MVPAALFFQNHTCPEGYECVFGEESPPSNQTCLRVESPTPTATPSFTSSPAVTPSALPFVPSSSWPLWQVLAVAVGSSVVAAGLCCVVYSQLARVNRRRIGG